MRLVSTTFFQVSKGRSSIGIAGALVVGVVLYAAALVVLLRLRHRNPPAATQTAPVLATIAAVRRLAAGRDLDLWIQVDGGVTEETAVQCVEAGANVLVAGSAVFGAEDPAEAVRRIRAAGERAAKP